MARIPLKAARVANGWTQAELAKKLGVSRETVLAWEQNPEKMQPYHFYAFLHVTGFDACDIFMPEGFILNEQECNNECKKGE